MKASRCCSPKPLQRPSLKGRPAELDLNRRLLAALGAAPHPVLEDVAVGGRFVAVLAGGCVGLASTLGARPKPEENALVHRLRGKPLIGVARLLFSDSPILATVGLAALNALCAPPEQLPAPRSQEWLEGLCRGRQAVVVGDFPFIPRLKAVASALHVMELRPVSGSTPARRWGPLLASCEVTVITGTALLTRSLAWFLAKAHKAVKVLIGPSTPMSTVLFEYGADILAGCRVTDPPGVLKAVRADGSFREIKKAGVQLIAWPRPGEDLDL